MTRKLNVYTVQSFFTQELSFTEKIPYSLAET